MKRSEQWNHLFNIGGNAGKPAKRKGISIFVGIALIAIITISALLFTACPGATDGGNGTTPDLSTAILLYSNSGAITATEGTANDTGISPTLTPTLGNPAPTGISYSIAAATEGSVPTTDGAGTAVIIDASTGKVTLTAQAVEANSGRYIVTATAGSASNYLEDSTQIMGILVTVRPAGTTLLNTATFTYGAISATLGTAMDIDVEWTPASGSPAPTGISYSIAAATGDKAPQTDGAGTTVTIDLSTGKITLTAQAVEANSGDYVVTATATSTSNYDPTSTQTSTITVELVLPALNAASLVYNPASVATTVGTANTTGIDPEWGSPTPTNIVYSIAAAAGDKAPEADGAGDTVKIDSSTGKVTLTAGAISTNAGEYVVTVTAGANSNYQEASATTAIITVLISTETATPVTSLSYSSSSIVATIGIAIGELTPTLVPGGATGIYSAILPDGLEVVPSTGIISGTPTTNAEATSDDYVVTFTASGDYSGSPTATITISIEKPNLNTAALAYDGSGEITTTAKTAETTGISPVWTPAAGDIAVAEISYSIAAAATGTVPSTDGTGTAVVIDSTSGKVTLTDQVLVANGGEYVVTATAGAASNYQQDSTQTATITVTVSKIPVTGLSYSSQSIDANAYSAITALTPTTVPNGATGSYSGNLPAGLEVHPTTGIISGTPTTVTAKASYTVTFNADGEYFGSPTADIEISVKKPDLSAATLAYNPTSISTIAGTAIATGSGIAPTWTPVPGAPTVSTGIVYSIAAATGDDAPDTNGAGATDATVIIDSASGEVTLTDRAIVANSGSYVVSATADAASDYQESSIATTTITVGISAKTAEEVTSLSYSSSSIVATIGVAIGELTPTLAPGAATGTYSASLPDGLEVVPSTGIISGTPTTNAEAKSDDYVVTFTASGDYYGSPTATITINVKKPNLSDTLLDYSPASISTTAKTANSTGISPVWTPAAGDIAVTEISYSIAAATTGNNIPPTDGADTAVMIDPSTGIITLMDQVLVANGGEYVVTATAGANSNYQQDSTQTAAITVTVNAIPITSLSYSSSRIDTSIGLAITDLTPILDPSGATGTYSAALPAGLNLEPSSGKISGTPTAAVTTADYTVTFTADGDYTGTETADIKITVKTPVTGLSYSPASIDTSIGVDIGTLSPQPVPSGATGTYSGTLPDGLNLDPSSGEITGAPTTASSTSSYTVTFTADGDYSGTQSVDIDITVKTPVKSLSYSPSNLDTSIGVDIGELSPTLDPSGATGTYSVDPTLPDGLILDESGKITGVPTTSAAVATTPVEYTVTFTATADGDYTGTKTATIQISVKKPNLNTAALGYSPASMSTTAKTANSTGISPNWTPAAGNIAVTQIIYSIAAATTGNNIPATDGADTTVSIDSSTGKVTLTAQVGVANSGEYVVTATAGANSNYLQGSTQTAAITVTVNAIPVTGLSYSTSSMDATIGTAIAVEATPTTVPSGATGTYSVDPALPNGLTLDESGKIGGTPTVLAAAVSHTVTFTADGDYSGTPTAAITISVKNPNLSTAVLNYSNQGTISADMGTASTITPDWTPATGNSDPTDISYSIAATTGINAPTTDGSTGANPGIEIDLTTGTVSITADAIIDNSGKYMITATAGASSNYLQGSTQNVFITVEVKLGSVSGLKPGDGQITANSNPTLSWNAVTGATSYDFQIAANDENAVTSAALQSLFSTEYTWTTTTLVNGNKLYWRVRAKDVSGRVGDWSDIVSMEFKGYSVGDTGPAGGYILYDKGSISDGWRYLEVAPTDVVVGKWNDRFIWGNSTGSLTLSSAVGAGKANTAAILKDIGNPEAASACDGAVYNSYDDWFLPASDTLIEIYNNRSTIGGFVTGNNAEYWSSSTNTAKDAVVVYFNDTGGRAIGGFSSEYGRARPVRTF